MKDLKDLSGISILPELSHHLSPGLLLKPPEQPLYIPVARPHWFQNGLSEAQI